MALVVLVSLAPFASAMTADSPHSSQTTTVLRDVGSAHLASPAARSPAQVVARAAATLPDGGITSVDPTSAQTDASCGPVVHLTNDWYGGKVAATRRMDEQVLLPVAVTGQLQSLLPGAVGGLLASAVRTIQSVTDLAVRAVWDEELLHWTTYTDHLDVGLAGLDEGSMTQLDAMQAAGWVIQSVDLTCGPAVQGVQYTPDPRSGEAQFLCALCTQLPADSWQLANILSIDVRIAKATDYAAMLPTSMDVGTPDQVVAAVNDRVQQLAPSFQDCVQQQAERIAAGLRPLF
jgi:hypothetical protein